MCSYEEDERRISALLKEVEAEGEFDKSDSESSDDSEELDHNSDTETDGNVSDYEDDIGTECNLNYVANNKKTKWMVKAPPTNVRTRFQNIVSQVPRVKGNAKSVKTALERYLLFLDEDMLKKITGYTNVYITQVSGNYSRERNAKTTDEVEIRSFIGLLLLAGFYRGGHLNLKDLWNTDGFGVEIFHTTMSLYRFLFLLRCIRFDNILSREERRKVDKLAAVREIFELFLENCRSLYSVSEYTTVDEQLVPFRGRCSYRPYIPSKPAKYGLKIFTLCDAKSWYALDMEIYVGTQPDGPFKTSNSPKDVVIRLSKTIEGTCRNITADNCSYNLAEELSNRKLTLVGTLRKNKPELPPEFVNLKNREANSSLFGFQKDKMIIFYVPKKKKNVIMISTMHFDDKIDDSTGDKKKPEVITMYNKTKSGVDVLDEMCATYSTSRKTRRWPLVIFFRLLDIAGINSMVIYSRNNPKSTMVRKEFLREIAVEMIKPAISRRAAISSLPKRIKRNATKMTRDQSKNSESSTKAAKLNEGSQGSRNRSECAGRCGSVLEVET